MKDALPSGHKLLAWVERSGEKHFIASFVGVFAVESRAPAIRVCTSLEEAHRWIDAEARGVGLPVEYLEEAPRGNR